MPAALSAELAVADCIPTPVDTDTGERDREGKGRGGKERKRAPCSMTGRGEKHLTAVNC